MKTTSEKNHLSLARWPGRLATGAATLIIAVTIVWRIWAQDAAPVKRAIEILAETMSPEELADLAITYPAELEQLLAPLKTEEEKQVEAEAAFAIRHPVEYAEAVARSKTPQQLEQEAASLRAILQPAEYQAELAKLKTPQQLQEEAESIARMLQFPTSPAGEPMVPTRFPVVTLP